MRKRTLYAALGAAVIVASSGLSMPLRAQSAGQNKILFVSNRASKEKFNIFAMNPDGSEQTNLTKTEGIEVDPVWSPDGKQIAFTLVANPKEPKADIYVMDADGKNRKRLTQSEVVAFSPTWSPDGKRIAYSTMQMGPGGPPKVQLYVMDADGKNRKELGKGMGMMPAWSPDGKKILYTTLEASGTDFDPRLYVMDMDGSNAKALILGKAMAGAWSPDGKRIAYMAEGGGDQPDIFVMNADGSQPMQLTKTEELEFGPQWSADGKWIFFTRLPKGAPGPDMKAAIYSMDSDGKNVKPLTKNDALDFVGSALFVLMTRMEARPNP